MLCKKEILLKHHKGGSSLRSGLLFRCARRGELTLWWG